MSYPIAAARQLVQEIDALAARSNTNVFLGEPDFCSYNDDQRTVRIDVTRSDWVRLKRDAISDGWMACGGDCLIHDLPQGNSLIVQPSF